ASLCLLIATPFPYTTLFRSGGPHRPVVLDCVPAGATVCRLGDAVENHLHVSAGVADDDAEFVLGAGGSGGVLTFCGLPVASVEPCVERASEFVALGGFVHCGGGLFSRGLWRGLRGGLLRCRFGVLVVAGHQGGAHANQDQDADDDEAPLHASAALLGGRLVLGVGSGHGGTFRWCGTTCVR